MEFYASIQNRRIIPLYEGDEDELRKLKGGKEYKFKITAPRNIKFHKKFFALLNLGYQNTDTGMNFEEFRAFKTMQAGYYNRIVTEKGEFYLPKSISFASMDETEFESLYNSMVNVMIKTLGCTPDDIENELINFF